MSIAIVRKGPSDGRAASVRGMQRFFRIYIDRGPMDTALFPNHCVTPFMVRPRRLSEEVHTKAIL